MRLRSVSGSRAASSKLYLKNQPEVLGLFLKHVANPAESEKTVTVASHDLFQRVASSIEQIAELNHYELAVSISGDATPADDRGAGGESKGGEQCDKKPSEGLSYDQIKDALKAKGIEFQANAKKADLAALLDAAPADDDGGECSAAESGQTRAELEPALAKSLFALTDEGDDAIQELNYCIDAYNAARQSH